MKTMIRYAIFFLLVGTSLRLSAQEKFWIYFSDKGTSARSGLFKSHSSPEAVRQTAQLLSITERSLERRARRATVTAQGIDESDLPVALEYLAALRAQGVLPVTESRWLNAVSVRFRTDDERERIRLLPCVRMIEPVKIYRADTLHTSVETERVAPKLQREAATGGMDSSARSSLSSIDYGPSLAQLEMINIPRLHALGITGRGIIVGMLDSGFRWKKHEALEHADVIAEYDFIQNDANTANEAGDSNDQDEHGTKTMSVLGGFMPGQLVGPAFGASFMLGKTEFVPQELNSEEDHWVAGIEWLERNGADVVSSSLGYSEFDPGQRSYTYQDMNGRTAVTSIAAVIAARKGVCVCVAMGNEGAHAWHYLTSPADADSIISVGAVSGTGDVAGFSSVGPTSDGRMKPDVCARGVSDICASPSPSSNSLYVFNSGTSLSTPLIAGTVACLLSARPELTPIDVRRVLRESSSNAQNPDNSIGWGIPDAYKALVADGLLVSAQLDVRVLPDSSRHIAARILSGSHAYALVPESLVCQYSLDNAASFLTLRLSLDSLIDSGTKSGVYGVTLPKHTTHFYLSAKDAGGNVRQLPFNAPAVVYTSDAAPIARRRHILPEEFALEQNFPNPFNGRTTIRYALPSPSHVTLSVYDLLGREVARLVDHEDQTAGIHTAVWDGVDRASGVYFYSIRTGEFTQVKKLLLIR
ncbi:MAG TPA: S8 family peptidase [Bacteroidota bacterium]|nr:S8 family peptidase [Bacteroidota bacterium]